jgi:hypothetical protein
LVVHEKRTRGRVNVNGDPFTFRGDLWTQRRMTQKMIGKVVGKNSLDVREELREINVASKFHKLLQIPSLPLFINTL